MAVPDVLNRIRGVGEIFFPKAVAKPTHFDEQDPTLSGSLRILCDIYDLQKGFNTRLLLTGKREIDIADLLARK